MRIVKEHNERRDEILKAAETLFSVKGYDKCTVNDILNVVGIAKGTFYHYFKSKEEVLDAIIQRITDMAAERAEKVMQDTSLSPLNKLMQVFIALRVEEEVPEMITEEIHKTENALMHQKSLNAMVNRVSPILASVVKEGSDQGVFQTDYPEQYMKIFLTASGILMDEGVFQVKPEEAQEMLTALFALLAKMLGVPETQVLAMMPEYLGV